VGGGDYILKFLASENVNANKMALGMAMLPSLGGRNLNNLEIVQNFTAYTTMIRVQCTIIQRQHLSLKIL
jgi:hypothetical protein